MLFRSCAEQHCFGESHRRFLFHAISWRVGQAVRVACSLDWRCAHEVATRKGDRPRDKSHESSTRRRDQRAHTMCGAPLRDPFFKRRVVTSRPLHRVAIALIGVPMGKRSSAFRYITGSRPSLSTTLEDDGPAESASRFKSSTQIRSTQIQTAKPTQRATPARRFEHENLPMFV